MSTTFLSQTPLRLPFGGAGTDAKSYYEQRGGGAWLTATTSQSAFVILHVNPNGGIITKHSDKVERVGHYQDIQTNPMLRTTLELMEWDKWKHRLYTNPGLEIDGFCDAPARSGLGVTGAMMVGLLQILHLLRDGHLPTHERIAEVAYRIITEDVGMTEVGWQDFIAAAYGGFLACQVKKDELPMVERLELSPHTMSLLQSDFLLFGSLLEKEKTTADEDPLYKIPETGDPIQDAKLKLDFLDRIKAAGLDQLKALLKNDVKAFGLALNRHWELNCQFLGEPDSELTTAHEQALQAGALSGNALGPNTPGASMLFYCPQARQQNVRQVMQQLGWAETHWTFEQYGSRLVFTR